MDQCVLVPRATFRVYSYDSSDGRIVQIQPVLVISRLATQRCSYSLARLSVMIVVVSGIQITPFLTFHHCASCKAASAIQTL